MTTTPTQWLVNPTLLKINTSDAGKFSDVQKNAKVTGLANGNWVVTWQDESASHSGTFADYDIKAQILDPLGRPVGEEFVVNTTTLANEQELPDITALPDGGFVIAYQHDILPGNSSTVYYVLSTRYDAEGNELFTKNHGSAGPGVPAKPAVTAFADSSYVVAFNDTTGTTGNDVSGQTVRADGTMTPRFSIGYEPDIPINPALATMQNGNFVAVYSDNPGGAPYKDIVFRIFDQNGYLVKDEVVVDTDIGTSIEAADVAVLSGGSFVVTWPDITGGPDGYNIQMRAYDADGNPLHNNIFTVNTTTDGIQKAPQIVALDDNDFVVVWWDSSFTSSVIRARRFHLNGEDIEQVGTEFVVTDAAQNMSLPDLTVLADGRIAFAGTVINAPSNYDVAATIFDPRSGDINGTEGDDVLTAHRGISVIDGLGGNDTLYSVDGSDTVRGGDGDDRLVYANQYDGPYGYYAGGYDLMDGGDGFDTADFSPFSHAVRVDLGLKADQVSTQFDVDLVDGSSKTIAHLRDIEKVIGSAYHDELIGNAGDNIFEGGLGTDIIDGREGRDTVSYADASGGVTVNLADGAATGADGPDKLVNVENVVGSAYDDNLIGDFADNHLDAGAGNDRIIGAGGIDTLTGGSGADVFQFDEGDTGVAPAARDRVTDFQLGADQIDLSAIDADVTQAGNSGFRFVGLGPFDGAGSLRIDFNEKAGVTTLEGDTDGDGQADFAIDFDGKVILGEADFTKGSLGTSSDLVGTEDADVLEGGAEAENIFGLGDNDTLSGFGGNDTLDGGKGADVLTGGDDADVFQFGDGDTGVAQVARDRVTDFQLGADQIDLADMDADVTRLGNNGFHFVGLGPFDGAGSLRIDFNEKGGVTTLEGDTDGDGQADFAINFDGKVILGEADFTQGSLVGPLDLVGTAAADVLEGDAYGDKISGLGGIDILRGFGGNDLLDGGAGADLMQGGRGDDQYFVDDAGDQAIETQTQFSAPAGWKVLGRHDFDGNGETDVIVSNGSVNQLWTLSGGKVAATHDLPDWKNWPLLGIADTNGDGQKDLIYYNAANNEFWAEHLDGTTQTGGAYVPAQPVDALSGFAPPAGWSVVGSHDFDGDGEADVVVTNGSVNQLWTLSGGKVAATHDLPAWSDWPLLGIADTDGNGQKELLYHNPNTGTFWATRMDGTTPDGGEYVAAQPVDQGQALDSDGTDTVIASVSYTLAEGVENMTLKGGAGSINGTGNALDNILLGNEGDNVLTGGAGADILSGRRGTDTMIGGDGDDTYYVDRPGDLVIEEGGETGFTAPPGWRVVGQHDFDGDGRSDVVVTNGTVNQIWTLSGGKAAATHELPAWKNWPLLGIADTNKDGQKDLIYYNAASNEFWSEHLDGTTQTGGAYVPEQPVDAMSGFAPPAGWSVVGSHDFDGSGENDVVITNGTVNQIWILSGGEVAATHELPAWADWPLLGITDVDGNGQKELLYYNAADDKFWAEHLDGTTQTGSAYVDTQSIDPVKIIGGDSGGVDTVVSELSYALGDNVENLILNGGDDIDATGNDLANVLTGNSGDNVLTGGGGADRFVFGDAWGHDTITDFDTNGDLLDFSNVAALNEFSDLTIAYGANDTTISYGNNTVTLVGVDSALTEDDFILSGSGA